MGSGHLFLSIWQRASFLLIPCKNVQKKQSFPLTLILPADMLAFGTGRGIFRFPKFKMLI